MVQRDPDRRPNPLQLTPELLVAAYGQGVFPMARSRHAVGVEWFSPDPRTILPLDGFHCPRTVRQRWRQGVFEIRYDSAFDQVIRACAEPREDHADTWINTEIIDIYGELHRRGQAHSVEAWLDGNLVGGLYGVALGGAFFGESMFHRPDLGGTDASKICLVDLVERLKTRRFILLDVQLNSDHMQQFGTVDVPRGEYQRLLDAAVGVEATW